MHIVASMADLTVIRRRMGTGRVVCILVCAAMVLMCPKAPFIHCCYSLMHWVARVICATAFQSHTAHRMYERMNCWH